MTNLDRTIIDLISSIILMNSLDQPHTVRLEFPSFSSFNLATETNMVGVDSR